jgi:hypothetical protein
MVKRWKRIKRVKSGSRGRYGVIKMMWRNEGWEVIFRLKFEKVVGGEKVGMEVDFRSKNVKKGVKRGVGG